MNYDKKKYKTISEVAKLLNLVDLKTGRLSTHTIRFWQKEFRQIKPHIFSGKRRYYDDKCIKILKKVHFLLKVKGMTIKGVKKELDKDYSELDLKNNKTINSDVIKDKINKISNIIKHLKKNG
tara:strand:+ start:201 stop:569 length:369 start_codon:yes stop_codon:yes gene_type:complete